ncbi:MAG: hypothetical protein HQM01_14520 [Magnetococcales bacterium]|nr:hypothetical protein [Magnetococcales bacterium]MBF0165693.1 hypothetical protein [Magnetococcales bacterium]
MHALRQIIEDAPEQLTVALPPHLHHRRVEVIVLPMDEAEEQHAIREEPRYQRWPTKERIIPSRDELHER